jgi:hypothetical protein
MRFVEVDATRFPKTLVSRIFVSSVVPAVVTRLMAHRVNPWIPESMFTRV